MLRSAWSRQDARLLVGVVALAIAVLAGPATTVSQAYVGETEPATNILDDGVNLNAKVSYSAGESGVYWFEWRAATAPYMRTMERAFGPTPAAGQKTVTEFLRPNCDEIAGPCTQVSPDDPRRSIEPGGGYRYRFCRRVTAPAPVSTQCFDSVGTVFGSNLDTWASLETWDDTSHVDEPCPDPAAPDGSGASCLENDGPASFAADDATYSLHWSGTNVYGAVVGGRITEIWGTWQWFRDINLNGSQAQIWQAGSHLSGPALRYDMRMKLYRGDNHYLVDEWREIKPSSTTFSKSHQAMTTRFPRGRAGREYHLHWRVIFRASGMANPSHPQGLFQTPVSRSKEWVCHADADGDIICFFPA